MSSFKRGDTVVCLNEGSFGQLVAGDKYVLQDCKNGYVEIHGIYGTRFPVYYFLSERHYVEMCLNAITDRGIVVESITYSSPHGYGRSFKFSTTRAGRHRVSREALLDYLYPIKPVETSEQKELRELEEQQRKLADKMKSLREKINGN